VPRGHPALLAETIVALLADEAERRRLAAGARGAARLFAWPRIASGALALYRRVLACG
jgi:glycosyltransferase involved in cell wall biosynthesis